MYGWDLAVVPGPPQADLQRQVLEEWLGNPFLDDDIAALSLRLGAPMSELDTAVTRLCDTGFLRATGTGFTLAIDLGGTLPDIDDAPEDNQAAAQLASLSGALVADTGTDSDEGEDLLDLLEARDRADDLTKEIEQTLSELLPDNGEIDSPSLIEALPFGMIVLLPTGAREMANSQAAEMLGVTPGQLDAATFEILTGVNPLAVFDRADQTLSFSLIDPVALEVSLQVQSLNAGTVILVMLRDVSLLEEVSKIQADVQEELYERLQSDMVEPLTMVERFIEKPDAEGLVQARVAMEQINWFLQEFFLQKRDRG